MRIVGGTLRGRPIAAPRHEGLRPTSDRAREAMFNILSHGIPGPVLAGAKVLDLFAGTGALGLEALSRGAQFALFVDTDARARALIRTTIDGFGLSGVTRVFRRDATDLGPAGRYGGFTLVFADPPYGEGLAERALASAAAGGWLAQAALAVIEDHTDADLALPAGFEAVDRRTWGDTQVLFARYSSAALSAPEQALDVGER